jgi:hypothetical protein
MARKGCRAVATTEQVLTCLRTHWSCCGRPMAVAYRTRRTITTLRGSYRLILRVRRCRNPTCERYHRPYRPEEEGKWALPHGEFGLDVIALVGSLRYTAHRSIPEVHQALRDRGVPIAERTVTYLLQRYEELVALHLARWRTLHNELNYRHEARRLQYRFRKSPEQYLAALEEKLSKQRLRS